MIETELVAFGWRPGAVGECYQTPVTREGSRLNTWARLPLEPDEIEHSYRQDLGPDAVVALLEAFQVTVIDPRWGRNDSLWESLGAALGLDPDSTAFTPVAS